MEQMVSVGDEICQFSQRKQPICHWLSHPRSSPVSSTSVVGLKPNEGPMSQTGNCCPRFWPEFNSRHFFLMRKWSLLPSSSFRPGCDSKLISAEEAEGNRLSYLMQSKCYCKFLDKIVIVKDSIYPVSSPSLLVYPTDFYSPDRIIVCISSHVLYYCLQQTMSYRVIKGKPALPW